MRFIERSPMSNGRRPHLDGVEMWVRRPSLPCILDKLPANRRVMARRGANDGRLSSHPAHIPRETSRAIPAGSRAHPAIPASRMTGQHRRRSAADRARRSLCAGISSQQTTARLPIPRGSRAPSSARQTRDRRRDREPPRSTHMSRSAREELFRAAVSAPETRARLLPVESLVYEAEHDGVRGVHEMTAFDPLDLGRGHGLGHEVRHLRERRRRVLAGDD